jgi:flagellar motor switch protein FliN
MSPINAAIAAFLDALAGELQRLLSLDRTEQATEVSWSQNQPDSDASDLVWWSCALSVDPGCRIYAGADQELWRGIGSAGALDSSSAEVSVDDPQAGWFALLAQAIEGAAKARFGALVSCTELGISEGAPGAWARVSVTIARSGDSSPGTMYWVLSPELVAALGGEDAGLAEFRSPATADRLDILQHVEIPVSVSFGRTRMQLRDLLGLSNGSVVHLDKELGDHVEVRVNNRVIARGEVVAVDGNYGVRILEMTSSSGAQ